MSIKRFIPVIFLIFFAFPVVSLSQRSYKTSRLEGKPPVIDGIIDEPAWDKVDWAGDFVQREPYEGKSPSQLTKFRILYDDNNVYVAIRAYDSVPSAIVSRLSRRDNLDADWVGVMFDSYNDKRTAFGFAIAVSGVKMDLMEVNEGQDNVSWDAIWMAKTHTDSLGWSAEFKIPLSQLRFSSEDKHNWGLEVFRYIYRKQEMSLWQPIARNAPGFVSLFGSLTGIEGLHPKRDIEILPYLVTKAEYSEKEDGNPFATGHAYKFTAGVDGKIGLTNDLTLNFTVNPDFGQVESDPSEVNLTAYESYFSEKRPFFIEGKNIFDFRLTGGDGDGTNNTLFYSRRIGRTPHYSFDLNVGEHADIPASTHILGSFKLSGKTKKGLSIGVLESFTSLEKATVDLEGVRRSISTEPFTNYFVGRLQRDFNKGSSMLGGIVTATNRFIHDQNLDYLPASAYTAGLDFTHTWKNKTYYFNIRAVATSLNGSKKSITELQQSSAHYFQSPDKNYVRLDTNRTSLLGQAGTFEIGKQGNGHFNYMAWITWRSPGVDFNDIGYMRQADEIQQVFWIGYRQYAPAKFFRNYGLNYNEFLGWNFGGESIYRGMNVNGYAQFKNYWNINAGANLDGTNLDRSQLRGGPALVVPGDYNYWIGATTDNRKKLSFETNINVSRGFDRYFQMQGFYIGGTYKPINSLSVSLYPNFSYGYNDLQYVTDFDYLQGHRYILSRLDQKSLGLSIRLDYTLTTDLTFQFYGEPFLFAGKYSNYKRITDPRAGNYKDRSVAFTEGRDLKYDAENGEWLADENQDGLTDYSFTNGNFNFMQFRSNLVLRWEYRPGSTLFLVWSQGRTNDTPYGNFDLHRDVSDLFGTHPQDVLLVKVSYMLMF